MRYKTPSDYRYMVEPNIAPINILKLINEVTLEPSELPSHIKNELIKQGINEGIVEQLLDDLPLYKGFKYVSEQTNNQKAAIN
jgi:Asp-tRNA(Asn)/Glu-tRNA(Gln) amidotransferase B subunit